MGKKTKKTRWRTLALNGHQSDSEESCSKSNGYQRKYSKFFYSSHSSPVRKYQNDISNKTTRSNSTTSEQKTTFNEDEYTRITTPRQDVLFKKGYLNKPKPYQTQTSTGASSTANSTSTCTPDHQSADGTEGTDIEYESQLVFPNGFIDHNGIYYINSFEAFPFVVYNASPMCYPECTRTKRYSTDSMTESVSPHNEESGITQPSDEPSNSEEPRRLKKRRRRKISRSKSITSQESTDSNDVFKTEDDTGKPDPQNLLLQSLTKTYSLKPDAEEFIPRNFRALETFAFDPSNVQFVPNFIPVPFIGDMQRPLLPINFIPPNPTFINVIPNTEYAIKEEEAAEQDALDQEPQKQATTKKSDIDIAKIVLKLEEAAKQQKFNEKKFKSRGSFTNRRFNRYRNEKPKISEVEEKKGDPKTVEVVSRLSNDCSNVQKIVKRTKAQVVEVKAPSPARTPLKPNQWISVSSRKKRKNKGSTDEDATPPAQDIENDDLFESFDVNLLVDVVPPSQEQTPEPQPTIEVAAQEPPQPAEESEMHQKKKKKRVQKPQIKKVMVTDLPLPEIKVPEPPRAVVIVEPELEPEPEPEPKEAPPPEVVEPKTSEKKKKKKKKPLQKVQSVSSSNTTLNGDDSYDFLIENSILEEFDQKTNVEISEELDRMIQKGMYSHLEEKIKSLNLDSNDDFFKIVEESQGTKAGVFRWNSQEFQDKGEDYPNQINLNSNKFISVSPEPILKQYPITEAVKEWMTKTRENTPDVDILKSPNTILKEFYESETESPNDDGEDVTVWCVNQPQPTDGGDSECDNKTKLNGHIEDCEEAVEAYESNYGKNEDFLKIKDEVNRSYPRHGNLPYRAICCNLM